MFSRKQNIFSKLFVFALLAASTPVYAENAPVISISDANLPINVSDKTNNVPSTNSGKQALVSPSKAKSVSTNAPKATAPAVSNPAQAASMIQNANLPTSNDNDLANANTSMQSVSASVPAKGSANADMPIAAPAAGKTQAQGSAPALPAAGAYPAANNNAATAADFNFDLKMKSINAPAQPAAPRQADSPASASALNDADLPKDIQYKANPVEALGNSVLSQMDSDLFSQMSEIEKSTTLLTLELRREKIRNEIEAQRAIRKKNAEDLERQKEERRLQSLEKEKQIEAQVLKEKQALLDKEQLFEILKQRKLLNAYMNQMLVNQQKWLKEKESLYAQIAAVESEKKELIELFKQRIGKVLDASAKNIQVAEAAKANFERIVKNLKARNEQLRKRVAADAQIIKNAKNSLYLKSQSIDELKSKNAAVAAMMASATASDASDDVLAEEDMAVEEEAPAKLSSQYAILGISGRANDMVVEVIDINGQPLSLKIGSPLPTGHIVSEIGADYAKFSRDGEDDYLYVGRTIDGYIPTLKEDTKKK